MKCSNCNKWVDIECDNSDDCSNNKSFGRKMSKLLQEMVDTVLGKEVEIKADNKSDNNHKIEELWII